MLLHLFYLWIDLPMLVTESDWYQICMLFPTLIKQKQAEMYFNLIIVFVLANPKVQCEQSGLLSMWAITMRRNAASPDVLTHKVYSCFMLIYKSFCHILILCDELLKIQKPWFSPPCSELLESQNS